MAGSDVPDRLPADVQRARDDFEIAALPEEDGAYWTLAAARRPPAVVQDIDWGSRTVYDQTRQRAEAAGLRFCALPPRFDANRPEDIAALCWRLAAHLRSGRAAPADDPLRELAAHVEELCGLA